MKKQNSQEEVFNKLNSVFDYDDGDVLLQLKKDAKEYKLSPTKIETIWRRIFELEQLTTEQLCIIYTLIQKQYLDELPAPGFYFTDLEIRNAEGVRHRIEEDIKDSITLNNVTQLRDDMYLAALSIQELVKWDNNNKIIYNRETQRPTIWGKNNTEKNYLSTSNVLEIAGSIIDGLYYPDEVKLNLLQIPDNSLKYNQSKRALTIKGDLNIIDGYHRLAAMQIALTRYPHCGLIFPVTISHLPVPEAQQIIVQHGKEQEIDKKYLAALENTAGNYIVKEIINSPAADANYSKKIVKTMEDIKFKRGFILYSELSQAIEKEYNLQKTAPLVKRDEIRDWLIEYFNQLTVLLHEDWRKQSRTSWVSKHFAFPGYVFLSKELRGRDDWKSILYKVIKYTERPDLSDYYGRGRNTTKALKKELEKHV